MRKMLRKCLPMIVIMCMLITTIPNTSYAADLTKVTDITGITKETAEKEYSSYTTVEAPADVSTMSEVPAEETTVTPTPAVTEIPNATEIPGVTGTPAVSDTPSPEALQLQQAAVNYEANDDYTFIVSVKTGKAVQVTAGNNTACVTADGDIPGNKGNNLSERALFQMRKDTANPLHVSFSSKAGGWRMLKSENISNEDIIDTGNALKTEVSGWEAFYLENLSNGTVAIKDGRLGKYLSVADDNRVMVKKSAADSVAEQFVIIAAKYEPEPDINAEVYMEHKATGKLVAVDGVVNNGISVNLSKTGTIPDNARFNVYYGTFNNASVVNFESKQYKTMWKSDGSRVFQINRLTPTGWESVTMEPQGDGTVAFKNNNNYAYLSVQNGSFVTPYNNTLTDNEKFIVRTDTAPKKVIKIKTAGIEGNSKSAGTR